ncbi:MAG: sodium ion-translocating decarboxylase subunit beta [Christensenellaceae bacterium]|nr:sodium ion-translocating decarboxylase subunit beta [Christensenellaceae bacterium]
MVADPVSLVKMVAMWAIGGILIYLAIEKDMEPGLLLPMGMGAILVNLPLSGAIDQLRVGLDGIAEIEHGPLSVLFNAGIANELFPLLLFIGIGAMCDFGPLLKNPKLLVFGAAAQFGIFFTILLAVVIGHFIPGTFSLTDAASAGIIGAADGPTAIFVSQYYNTKYMGAIMVAAYSYMALVPIIQPPCIRLVTTKKERLIRMPYTNSEVSRKVKILFPILVTVIAGVVAPRSVALVGFLMFGNLLRECGVLNNLSQTAQNALANLITIILGLTVAVRMQADEFLTMPTLIIMLLGLFAFVFDTIGGVMFAKFLNLFTKEKVNPMIGACGISAFPMSSRVVHKMGLAEDNQNFLLMHAAGVNVGGQVASVIAGGIVISVVDQLTKLM